MNRLEAINLTNEIISNLNQRACIDLLREVKHDILNLNRVIGLKYPELSGFYYDNECNMFCKQILMKHIIKQGIEMVAAVTF